MSPAVLLQRIGRSGVLGIGLLLFSAVFYLDAVASLREELGRLQDEAARLARASVPVPADPRIEAGRLPSRGELPPLAEAPHVFDRLQAAAERNAVVLERAAYSLTRLDRGGLQRYEMTLPLKGAYPNLRAFLHEALEAAPAMSLDEVSLRRQKAADAALEAQVRLSFHLAER